MILRRILAAVIPFVGVVGIVTACSSVPDITYGDGGTSTDGNVVPPTDGPRPDTNPPIDSGGDGPRDVMVDPNCVKASNTETNCEDGKDDDCDGLFDCEDPDCNPTHECVDKAPAGFDLLAVSDGRTTACATGFTDQADIEIVSGANPSCACKCTEVGGTCTGGTVDVTSSLDNTCAATTKTLNRTATNCTAIPGGGLAVGGNNNRFEAASAPTQPASCTPGANLTLPSSVSGRSCKPANVTNSAGCNSNQVCVRKPANTFEYCAVRPSPDAGVPATCTGVYSSRRRGGSTLSNTTTCDETACGCNNSACTGTLTIYETATCTVGVGMRSEDINTGGSGQTCQAMTLSGGNGFTALAYKAVSAGGCAATGSSAVQGSYALTNETTICCKP